MEFRKAYHGCFDQLSPYVGLTFCGDADISLSLPTEGGLAFPFNGPSTLSLRIEKEDLHQYHFRLLKNFDGTSILKVLRFSEILYVLSYF